MSIGTAIVLLVALVVLVGIVAVLVVVVRDMGRRLPIEQGATSFRETPRPYPAEPPRTAAPPAVPPPYHGLRAPAGAPGGQPRINQYGELLDD